MSSKLPTFGRAGFGALRTHCDHAVLQACLQQAGRSTCQQRSTAIQAHLAMASACRCLMRSRMLLRGLISILCPLPSRSRDAVSVQRSRSFHFDHRRTECVGRSAALPSPALLTPQNALGVSRQQL